MAAHLGVTNLFGLSAPAVGYVQESDRERTVDVVEVRDSMGDVKVALPKRLITETVTIKGEGDANFAAVAAGAFAAGVVKPTQAKQGEGSDGVPNFEMTGIAYDTRA